MTTPPRVFENMQRSILNADFTLAAAAGVQTAFPSTQDAFTAKANTTYLVRGKYYLNTGAISHTTAMAWVLSDATVAGFEYQVMLWSAALNGIATVQSTTHVTGIASKVLNAASAAVYTIIQFEGVIRFTNGGTITPQIAFSANPTGTNLMKRGSFVTFIEIGNDVFTNSGGWG